MQNALMSPQRSTIQEAEEIVQSSARLSGPQCLSIYQRGYYLRILKCMEEQFPALCHALGTELFRDFARQYLQACPSRSHSLYDLGRRFPDHLEATRPDRLEDRRESWIDFMTDLARFERQLFVIFDAPGHEGRPFANLDTPDDRLELQPCFALSDSRFPVGRYYHEVRTGNDPPLPIRERSQVVLVRRDYLTHTYQVSPPQFAFLSALDGGMNVLEALGELAQQSNRPLDQVIASWSEEGGVRNRWIEAGFFVERSPEPGFI